VAFVVSAAFHHLGAVTGRFDDGGYHQAWFFLLQPVGVMFEDLVIWYGARLGLRESGECDFSWLQVDDTVVELTVVAIALTKGVGFLWVFAWFLWSLRFIIASFPESWMDKYAFPSLIDNLFGG
jgi:hypothetical protein